MSETQRNTDMSQLRVSYRGSSIIGEDNIRDTTLKVSEYNKDGATAACPGDRLGAPEIPSLIIAVCKKLDKTQIDTKLAHETCAGHISRTTCLIALVFLCHILLHVLQGLVLLIAMIFIYIQA